jgi:RNA polymerase sigma factor (sigma-70 family)
MPAETDLRDLMSASLEGDVAAHRRLLAALVPVLRRYYVRRTNDGPEVEDLVQETIIAVHTRRASYDPARPFGPWLFAVARYKLIDNFRKRRATVPFEGLEDLLGDHRFEDETSARLDIDTLLASLPAKQAAAIRATKIEGLSVADVAARYGMSESDVKISVHRGIKAITKRLGYAL